MTKPITSEEVGSSQINLIPEFVIESFNELIVANYHRDRATVRQAEVITLIKHKASNIFSKPIFTIKWLGIEPLYEKAGWQVTYEPYFEFIPSNYPSKPIPA